MARRIQGQPDAVAQTLSLALTVKTQARFEVAEERGYVAGIHRDSEKPDSPYNFLINRTWTGARLSAQLAPGGPGAPGMSAALNLRLADPPQYADALGHLPSVSPGPPEEEAKEYHFQVASQTSADYAATEVFRLGHTRLLPLTWHTTGAAASQSAWLRSVAAILQEPAARY
jgi:ribosome modulation factor